MFRFMPVCVCMGVLLGVNMGRGYTRNTYTQRGSNFENKQLQFLNSLLKLNINVFNCNFPSLPDYLSEFLPSIESIAF